MVRQVLGLRRTALQRLLAGASGLFLGVGVGIPIVDGEVLPAILTLLLVIAVAVAFRTRLDPPERDALSRFAILAFSLHVSVATLLRAWSLAAGRGGFITGDDAAYARLAWSIAANLRGEPQPIPGPPWGGEAYLLGTWVYFEAALFYILGPQILAALILNGAFATLLALPVFDATRRVFDQKAAFLAAVLVAFWPSLVVWSALNLKEALALLLVSVVLWAVLRFLMERRLLYLVAAYVALLPMESLREYLFVGLAFLIPLAVFLGSSGGAWQRVRRGALSSAVSLLFVAWSQAPVEAGPEILGRFEGTRQAMTVGAHTAFAEPPPIKVQPGDTLVVGGDAASVSRTVYVPADVQIVVISRSESPPASGPGDIVYVRPGDVIVVGLAGGAPAPPEARRVLDPPTSGAVRLESQGSSSGESVTARTFAYLPTGLAHALFAPFPWFARRLLDLPVIAEMFVWYFAFAAMLVTLWRDRERWRLLATPALFVAGTLLLLALVEGNVGTLFRHRAMVIPTTLMLASPTIVSAAQTLARTRLRRVGRLSPGE